MANKLPPKPPVLLPLERLPWLRRWAARLLGAGLTRLGARHGESWSQGQAQARSVGRAQPRAAGAGDRRVPQQVAESQADALFDDWRLPLTPALRKRFKADVAKRLPATAQPSKAQWKLIFSDTPSTCVVAGAGAGKSTSLVLRLLLLHHYLGFEWDTMTVVTFTRESRKDFIQRLQQVFALWQINVAPARARELVRTFHSRVLPLARSLPGCAQLRAFETLGGDACEGFEDDDNPFDLRLNDAQRQQLNLCYRDLLRGNRRFAELIAALRREAMLLKPLDPDHPDVQKRAQVTQLAAQRDEELCDVIEDLWFQAGVWPIAGIEPCRETVQIRGNRFHVHGRLQGSDTWVVLGFDPAASASYQRPGAKLSVRAEWAVKRTLFRAFCDKPLIWLDSYQAASDFAIALGGQPVAGPGFEYKVRGELAPAPLLDAFVTAASFIENLGLEVEQAVAGMRWATDDSDALFFEALAVYWKAFEAQLLAQSPPVMTYNRMFGSFDERHPQHLACLPDTLLRPLSHLMIDEFQDVSPRIVSWLRATLTEIRRRGPALHAGRATAHSSLMCVGDDWQSIYGWRGSSPNYFTAFSETFPSAGHTQVMIVENYRSQQHIIDAAEHLVKGTPAIAGKKAKACGPAAELALAPVKVLSRDEAALGRVLAEHYRRGETVMMLFRKTSDKSLIAEHIAPVLRAEAKLAPERRRLRQLTYHSAKGLQADVVFMLGDCQYTTCSPYKNQAYRMAGLGDPGDAQPFDTAQRAEAQRLAYVGVTRAIRACYWHVEPANGEAAKLPRASSRVEGRQPFFDDVRAKG